MQEPGEFVTGPVQVMLATADPHLRLVVAQELAADPRTDLVAQPGSVAEVRWRMAQISFDVLLVDIGLGLEHVLEFIGSRCSTQGKPEVIVICALDDEDEAVQALNAGASGCLARNAWFGRSVQAVVDVATGGAALPPSLARRLLRQYEIPGSATPVRKRILAPTKASRLSERELEVLAMVARGLRTREIGRQLAISSDTVNAHIQNIYRKLHVRSRAHAVRIVTQAGLI